MWGEVEAAGSINDLLLSDGEVGEDGEAGQVDLRGQDQDKTRMDTGLLFRFTDTQLLSNHHHPHHQHAVLPVVRPRPRLGRRWRGSQRRG